MSRWCEIEQQAPSFSEKALEYFNAHKHKLIATIRLDGSPRISGIEMRLYEGDFWIGSMPEAWKARDLQRDPRCAIHTSSDDPPDWNGDAKLTARAIEITDRDLIKSVNGGNGNSHLFRLDILECSIVYPGDPRDHLVIEFWREGEGVFRIKR